MAALVARRSDGFRAWRDLTVSEMLYLTSVRAVREMAEATKLLREMEWADDGRCPICNCRRGYLGHYTKCRLAKYLSEQKDRPWAPEVEPSQAIEAET